MKLYKITRVVQGDDATVASREICGWATSDAAASKWCTALKKQDPENKPEREPFEVPTNRDDLVKFLNAFAAPAYCLDPEA